MQRLFNCWILIIVLSCPSTIAVAETAQTLWSGFENNSVFDEQVAYLLLEPEVRALIVAPQPERIVPKNPNRVILFATPNGNTIEQTLGCQQKEGRDWHFDIQHIAAQHRKWQLLNPRENLILVCLEARALSWPRWRAAHPDNPRLIRNIVAEILKSIPLKEPQMTLACHSGGGSFLWGYLNGSATIPNQVERLIFLDANYSFSVSDRHGKKLFDWLKRDQKHTLVVLAYDDRNVLFRGKKVVSPTGGTFRATHRMLNRFRQDLKFKETRAQEFTLYSGLEGQIRMLIHTNEKNQILHTRLVGEMNGYLYAVAVETPAGTKISLPATPRVYSKWIQPEPFEQPETEHKN